MPRQKGETPNGCFQKTKPAKFSEKRTFLTPWYEHVRFSENLTCFVFLKHPSRDYPFCLIADVCVETGLESRSTLETDPKSHILFHSLFDDKDKAVAGIL